jgi:uncharacterized phiE125 gp8 family phage protein
MMYRPVLITPPTVKPVTLAEAKKQCGASDFTDDDVLIGRLIDAATSYLDGHAGILNRCLVEQVWRQDYDCFERCMRLPLFPVISVASVKYDDASGSEQTVSSDNYSLLSDGLGAFVRFKSTFSFPSLHTERPAARIQYTAGYATSGSGDAAVSSTPEALKAAILLLVEHWYENRSAVAEGPMIALPFAVDALIAPFRRVGV